MSSILIGAWIIMGMARIVLEVRHILPEVIALFLLAEDTAGMKLCRRTVIIICLIYYLIQI